MRFRAAVTVVVITTLVCCELVAQTDTTFTYQGELKQSGQPANGNFNLTFALWDALAGGSQVGSDVALNAVPVSNGSFTVPLDFGAAAFNSSNRWLEIKVNGQILSPRQPVTAAPFAIKTRGIVVNEQGRVGIGEPNPSVRLDVRTPTGPAISAVSENSGSLVLRAHNLATSGSGTGIETYTGATEGAAIAAYAAHPTGVNYAVWAQATSPNGYAGYFTGGKNYFQGKVGIGVSDPSSKLEVSGGAAFANAIEGFTASSSHSGVLGHNLSAASGFGVRGIAEGQNATAVSAFAAHTSGKNVAVLGLTSSPDGYAAYFIGGRNYFERNVGIGIFDPEAKLHIKTVATGPGNHTAAFEATNLGPNASHIHYGNTGDWYIRSAADAGKVVLQDFSGGLVGIGVSNPSSEVKLHIGGEVRIDNLPSGNGTPLHINNESRLSKATSSRRYKEHIEPLDLAEDSQAFLQLQPVSYNYIGSSEPDIGLIAEDVAELVPEMVTYDLEGRPEAVKYDKGVLYLLEIVRQQQAALVEKDATIRGVLARLDQLESRLGPE